MKDGARRMKDARILSRGWCVLESMGLDRRAELVARLAELRPALHRYCARMTGSFVDGDDAVQETLLKALEAFDAGQEIARLDGWIFQIAHNATLDLLRRRRPNDLNLEDLDMPAPAESHATRAALRTFLELPASQRSSVILMDVLGYSLEEIAGIMSSTVPAVKASLHRGRDTLKALAARAGDERLVPLEEEQKERLARYVDRFNAHDFDAIRALLAEDVELDLVGRTRMNGRAEVKTYFHNYSGKDDWLFRFGLFEGRPAAVVCDRREGTPRYVVLLEWVDGALRGIRDFRYAGYSLEGVSLELVER